MAAKPYNQALVDLLGRVAARRGDHQLSPYFQARPVQNRLLLVISADRGLCGSYNHNINRRAAQTLEESNAGVKLITVGRRSRDHFKRRGVDIYDEFINLGENVNLELARTLGRIARYEFDSGRVDEVVLVFTQFQSVFIQQATTFRLLPVDPVSRDSEEVGNGLYLYEPSPAVIFDSILPRFIDNSLFRALIESKASEHAARVTAMKNATDNAGDLIEDLTRLYNRVRQSQITREITEIASGAEALAAARS